MRDLFGSAGELFQAGRYGEAAAIYEEVLAGDPANAAALHALGVVHNQRGEHDRAAELIGRAVALRPSVPLFHVNLGEAYRNLKEFDRAAGSCRLALRLRPDFPEAHNTLGLALQGLGRVDEAVGEFRKALAARPDMAAAHNNLGLALEESGRRAEALGHYRRAVELAPDLSRVRTNLAAALLNQGDTAGALPHFEAAARLDPGLAVLHHNLGNAYRALDRPVDARTSYLRALRIDPDLAAAHLHIGMTLRREGQLNDALPWYRMALDLDPGQGFAWEQLAELHAEREEPGEAVPCWERVLALSPGDRAAPHLGLGLALQDDGRLPEAEAQYRTAARLQPELAGPHHNLGVVHEELGAMAAAEAAFREALRLQPGFAMPHARLATLLRDELPAADLALLEGRLADPELGPDHRARLLFALAHVRDARGDFPGAADCLRRANALTLGSAAGRRDYSPGDHERFVGALIGAFSREFFGRHAGAGLETRRPVFVMGFPRSGTTLVEQVLASHPLVLGAGELRLARQTFESIPAVLNGSGPVADHVPRLDAASIRLLGVRHLEGLNALDGGRAERVVDKMPDNYLYLGLLAVLFPEAVFIHCRRDPRDVAVSCWMTDFRSIRWANHPDHLAARLREHERLLGHWTATLPVAVHQVDYEETVADLEGVAARLLSACGLDWEPACLEFHRTRRTVRTASITQVRRPLYQRSVARWKNYTGDLGELFRTLPHQDAVAV